jgi:hypothetical protein
MTTPDQQLVSEIPSAHPHKAAIGGRFNRLLGTLGRDWTASLLVEPGGDLGVSLRQMVDGRAVRFWSTGLSPDHQHPAALEAWLRAAARRLQDDLGLAVGFRVPGELTADQRARLATVLDIRHPSRLGGAQR